MEQRVKFFEQMKDRLETINEENQELGSGGKPEKMKTLRPVSKNEYITRVKARLNAWINELDRWEAEAYQMALDEDYLAQIHKLDQKLSEGYEKLRDLMGTTDESWDGIKKEADILLEDIMSTFDLVRETAGGGLGH